MKGYPSIPKFRAGVQKLYTFDKVDGSQLRFQYSAKRGWYKFGTRHRLFDRTDQVFGEAVDLFLDSLLSRSMAEIAKGLRWDSMIAFTEFHGPNSFAGQHEPGDPKRITLFDVVANKKGFLHPAEFVKLFGHLDIPHFLGVVNWTQGWVDSVRNGEVKGITFEGVVGKVMQGSRLIMCKAKTQAWIDKVFERYGLERGREIVES
jgi:hypothetical protein